MKSRGKKYIEALKALDSKSKYPLEKAVGLLKDSSYAKFDASIDLAINLGVDPRHAEQNVRGSAVLPKGLGKKVRVVVFAKGEKAVEAKKLGAEYVGAADLAEKISEGWLAFDKIIATPDMMPVVGKLGKILGPRGLMPNPRMGSVTVDVVSAISVAKSGCAEFKVDKAGVIHTNVGKVSMNSSALKENIDAVLDAVLKVKPSSSKGRYIKKMHLSATMGPSIAVDIADFI
ncbi:50S ribosomal protein L1 [bacterium]|jgi:large subunit ribosomal protein L1|nr:50S ribosomal protein L1 [bacterium]